MEKEKQKRNHDALLVTLADRNFIDQAKQLFSSVYWNAGWKGDYMLLSHEIPEKDLKWFRDKGILVKKCNFLDQEKISSKVFDKGKRGLLSPIVLDKFYLFTLEFKKWRNIICLDPDTIVRGSLYRLSNPEGFSAVCDVSSKLRDQVYNKKLFDKEKKFELNSDAFSPAVITFPTSIIKQDSFNNLVNFSKNYLMFSRYYDILVWNLFFYKKWIKLPQEYNLWPKILLDKGLQIDEIRGDILRFVDNGLSSGFCWNKKNPFYKEWKSNLKKAETIDLKDKKLF